LTDCVYKHILQPTSTIFTIAYKGEDETWTQKVLAAALLSLVLRPYILSWSRVEEFFHRRLFHYRPSIRCVTKHLRTRGVWKW